tara:strand:- start:155 stop:502 length:348 start_codon:yes stop_codon:yes gene_type:complete
MNHLKLLKNLNNNLFKFDNKLRSVKFFKKDIISIKIWFQILLSHYNNKDLHSEDIISNIPREYASRVTVFKVIDDAVKKNFVFKIKDRNDKRKFNITPSITMIKEFENWCLKFKQ